jgi:glycosyltransferase involved in cell wall biosynthesis
MALVRGGRGLLTGVLFLAVRMQRGFGVSVVVSEVGRRLAQLRIPVAVGCAEHDGSYDDLVVRSIAHEPASVGRLAAQQGCETIVALTSPFFEALPSLAERFKCWAWEWGDPTPDFFAAEQEARAVIIANKRRTVYPAITGVIAGSEFLRSDVGWANCQVVYPASDHAPDLGPKTFAAGLSRPGSLRVGTLMRLGAGEARYKGNHLFREIKACCDRQGIDCTFVVAGRGTEDDAMPFRESGIDVRLGLTDEEKWEYLRGLDVFVSCSLWEGFNLPLAEAEAMGTVGLAFDVGAHPEVTPFVMGGISDVVRQLRAYSLKRALLQAHSATGYRFVRERFSWRATTQSLLEILSQ